MSSNVVWYGFLASFLAGMGTMLGAVFIFAFRKLEERTEDILLSTAAGIMLAATFFSLLLPAIGYAEESLASSGAAVGVVILGLLSGAVILWVIHRFTPHEHFTLGYEGPHHTRLRQIWLFVIAITLHNFPEGMAVGVGFAGNDMARGIALATGIGLQNIPEGLAVAAALKAIEYPTKTAFVIATLTGLVEPVGGLFGAAAVWIAQPLLPLILGFAAGAMLFVISDEIIPETHRRNHRTQATFALMAGFAVMMYLDATLG